MNALLTTILLLITTISFGQNHKFKNVDIYSKWIMGYQENPEPEKLFEAFKYGITNKKIANSKGRYLVTSFFGSIFRADSTVIKDFYDKIILVDTKNFHYGFIASL